MKNTGSVLTQGCKWPINANTSDKILLVVASFVSLVYFHDGVASEDETMGVISGRGGPHHCTNHFHWLDKG